MTQPLPLTAAVTFPRFLLFNAMDGTIHVFPLKQQVTYQSRNMHRHCNIKTTAESKHLHVVPSVNHMHGVGLHRRGSIPRLSLMSSYEILTRETRWLGISSAARCVSRSCRVQYPEHRALLYSFCVCARLRQIKCPVE